MLPAQTVLLSSHEQSFAHSAQRWVLGHIQEYYDIYELEFFTSYQNWTAENLVEINCCL